MFALWWLISYILLFALFTCPVLYVIVCMYLFSSCSTALPIIFFNMHSILKNMILVWWQCLREDMRNMRAGGQGHLMPWFIDWCAEKAVKFRPRYVFTFIHYHILLAIRRKDCWFGWRSSGQLCHWIYTVKYWSSIHTLSSLHWNIHNVFMMMYLF